MKVKNSLQEILLKDMFPGLVISRGDEVERKEVRDISEMAKKNYNEILLHVKKGEEYKVVDVTRNGTWGGLHLYLEELSLDYDLVTFVFREFLDHGVTRHNLILLNSTDLQTVLLDIFEQEYVARLEQLLNELSIPMTQPKTKKTN